MTAPDTHALSVACGRAWHALELAEHTPGEAAARAAYLDALELASHAIAAGVRDHAAARAAGTHDPETCTPCSNVAAAHEWERA